MPRGKKGALTPRGAGGRPGSRGRGRFPSIPSPQPPPLAVARGDFTLADEARQTSQHDQTFWSQNSNLRKRPVSFVSAGAIEPLKQLERVLLKNADAEVERSPIPESDMGITAASDLEAAGEESSPLDQNTEELEADGKRKSEDGDNIIGPEELEVSIQAVQAVAKGQPDICTQADPSFFFDLKGQQTQQNARKCPISIPERRSSPEIGSGDDIILFKGRDAQRKSKVPADISLVQMHTEIRLVEDQMQMTPPPRRQRLARGRGVSSGSRRRRGNLRPQQDDGDEEAIIADYIANMRESGETEYLVDQHTSNRRDLGGSESDNATRPRDADTMEKKSIIPDAEADGKDSSIESSKDVAKTAGAGRETDVSEQESESELDDETLARLIQGHELGFDIDPGTIIPPYLTSDSDSSEGKQKRAGHGDDYDDFDLMDWNRPSLARKKGKGAQAKINFGVSDSDLEQALQTAWKSDRLKKSERKRQREELRALGMLGKQANPDDLRVKYPAGISMQEVAEELRSFLLGSDESLSLPPMDNHARKMIHELANKLKIKSKSTGRADQRRPVLYRTLGTLPFSESSFDQAVARINRRYFPRLDAKGKRTKRPAPARTSDAAASYRDGEIVGAAAPELGNENRGRTMLEKMGWSSGTALGATNKGILQPVMHAMKRTKAGLG